MNGVRRYASFETDPERKLHPLELAQELHNADLSETAGFFAFRAPPVSASAASRGLPPNQTPLRRLSKGERRSSARSFSGALRILSRVLVEGPHVSGSAAQVVGRTIP
jgi:hypothetical protein